MKIRFIILATWFCVVAAQAQSSVSDSMALGKPFHWKGAAAGLMDIPGTIEVADEVPGKPDKLVVKRQASLFDTPPQPLLPAVYTLRVLDRPLVSQITTHHYAITGRITYRNVALGSFLELENWFAPAQPGGPELYFFSRTIGDTGPMAKIEGSADDREFSLPFDSTGVKTALVRLVLKLHLTGAGALEFSNVRLMQYPNDVATPATVPLMQPAAGMSHTAKPGEDLILTLGMRSDGAGTVTVNGTAHASIGEIKATIEQRIVSNPKTSFIIRGTENVPYAIVRQVLDTLREAGAKNVFFSSLPPSPPQTSPDNDSPQPRMISSIESRSFLLGIAASLFSLVVFTVIIVLVRRIRQVRHARELRRIASLDG